MAINILLEKEKSNQFNQPCKQHGLVCTFFCPDIACKHFLCGKCEDPHSASGIIINSKQISIILKGRCNAEQTDSLPLIYNGANHTYQLVESLAEKLQKVVQRLDHQCNQEEAQKLKISIPAESYNILESIDMKEFKDEKGKLEILKERLKNANSLNEIREIVNLTSLKDFASEERKDEFNMPSEPKLSVRSKDLRIVIHVGEESVVPRRILKMCINEISKQKKVNIILNANKEEVCNKLKIWSQNEWEQKYKEALIKLKEKNDNPIVFATKILENKNKSEGKNINRKIYK